MTGPVQGPHRAPQEQDVAERPRADEQDVQG
jgi:hypothetical protein